MKELNWQLKAEVKIICRLNFSCQAALEDARKEWTNDMSQNFARGKVCSNRRREVYKHNSGKTKYR